MKREKPRNIIWARVCHKETENKRMTRGQGILGGKGRITCSSVELVSVLGNSTSLAPYCRTPRGLPYWTLLTIIICLPNINNRGGGISHSGPSPFPAAAVPWDTRVGCI